MKFSECLEAFSKSESIDGLSDALKERYVYIRYTPKEMCYPYKKNNNKMTKEEIFNDFSEIEKLVSTDYKKVSMLKKI